MTTRESARKVLKWFRNGKRWHQGSMYSEDKSKCCLFGATEYNLGPRLSPSAGHRLRAALSPHMIVDGVRGNFGHWNDHPSRTWDDVARLLRAVAYGRPYRP